jgi:phage terminase large subunit GpA-like protein
VKRSPLRRKTPLKARWRPSKRSLDPVTPETYTLVMARADGRCERCGERKILHWHHRLPVEHGGRSTVSNGLALCAACHTWSHNHPVEALAAGWLVERRADPAETPVVTYFHGSVRLSEYGEYL